MVVYVSRRKHNFHCQQCGSQCTIYKKGKGHRVLVCPIHGVIATNPTLAGRLLRGAASAIPVVGGVASEIISGIQENKAVKKGTTAHIPTEHIQHRTAFDKAVMLELLERH